MFLFQPRHSVTLRDRCLQGAEEEEKGGAMDTELDDELQRKKSVYTDPLKPAKKRRAGNSATGRRKGPPSAPGAKRERRLRAAEEPVVMRKSSRTSAVRRSRPLRDLQRVWLQQFV